MAEIINNQSNTVMYPNEDKYYNEWANDRDSNALYPTWLRENYPEVAAERAAARTPPAIDYNRNGVFESSIKPTFATFEDYQKFLKETYGSSAAQETPIAPATTEAPASAPVLASAPLLSGQGKLNELPLTLDTRNDATAAASSSVVLGMFPEVEAMQRALYQQKQNEAMQAQAMQFARLDPFEKASYGLAMGGQQLGDAIGGALGAKDPQMQMISLQNQMLRMVDPNKPETYDRAISLALQTGDRNTASILNDEKKNAQVRKTENLQLGLQKLAQTLYKPDGSIDENVYSTLQSYGAAGLAIIDQQVKGTQGLESQQVQNLARGLIKIDGTRNKEVEQQLSRTIAGREILKKFDPETKKTITIGNRVLDASNMSVLYTAPDAPPAAVAEWKAFKALPKNEQQSFLNLQIAKRPSTTISMPNEGERKAATLANRLNFSVDQINQAIGVDPSAAMPNTSIEIARFLSRTEMIPNKFTSAQRQIVESAQLDILDAALTLGTGAAYTRDQLEGYRKSYFPQINDKPENVAAKRARLQNILKSAEISSGRAKVPTPIPTLDADLSSIINAPPSN